MLLLLGGERFSTGRAQFFDDAPGVAEGTARIYVKVEPEGLGGSILALVDTGAPWSILATDVAREVGLLTEMGEPETILTPLGRMRGRLQNTTLTILADEGQSLEVQATVFVSPDWPAGNFLGYAGLLERIRFAVDPQRNDFYFGVA